MSNVSWKELLKLLNIAIPKKGKLVFGIFLSIVGAFSSLAIPQIVGIILNPSFVEDILQHKGYLIIGILIFFFSIYCTRICKLHSGKCWGRRYGKNAK